MGFTFLTKQPVVVDAEKDLEKVKGYLEEIAAHEKEALFAVSTDDPRAALEASRPITSLLWKRDWYWNMYKVVPHLVLELLKLKPDPKLLKVFKYYEKGKVPVNKGEGDYILTCKFYLQVLKTYREQVHSLQEAVQELSKTGLEAIAVGKFKLYNPEGVDIEAAKKVVSDAAKAMTSIGLGKYCYGNVTVTNSDDLIRRSTAFYSSATDEIVLSPNVSGKQDVRVLCHEIGHRVLEKERVDYRGLYAGVKESNAWVSNYAKTDAKENFCEMVSFAAIKDLSSEAAELLKSSLGVLKLASRISTVERVAARAIPIDKRQVAELAKDLVQKLKPRLNVKDKDIPIGQAIQTKYLEFEAGIFTGKTVFGNDVSIPVRVRWTDRSAIMRRYVPSGSAKGNAHKLKGRTYFFQMSLNLDLNRTANDFLTHLDEVEKEAYHVLIHEVTHAMDYVQASGESNKDSEGSVYHNDPAEVRAFLQQIIHEADEFTEYYGKLIGFSTKTSGPQAFLIESCLDKSKTWHRIKDDLTPANEKLIVKAVTRHLQDEWADLVRKYPEEVIDDGEEPWEEDNMPWLQRKVAARYLAAEGD